MPARSKQRSSRGSGPKIVIAQAGQINTGAFDPFTEIVRIAKAHGAWLHVDGAFGLWARAAPSAQASDRPASRLPIPGRPTATNGCRRPMIAASPSCATREAHQRAMTQLGELSAHHPAGRSRALGLRARAVAPGARRAGLGDAQDAMAATASPTWSSAIARWPGASPNGLARSRASASATRSCINQVHRRFRRGDPARRPRPKPVIARVQRDGVLLRRRRRNGAATG